MEAKFVAVLKHFMVRAGFVAVVLDLDARNVARARESFNLEGAFSARIVREQGAGVRCDALLESVSVTPLGGRRMVLAFPKPIAVEALDTMLERQVVVHIKKA